MGTGNYIRDNIAFKYSTVWHKKKMRQQGFKRFFVGYVSVGKEPVLKCVKKAFQGLIFFWCWR